MIITIALLVLALASSPVAAQLSLQWMVPAAANTAGLNGTYWHSDLSLHNPHSFELPVILQFLPSDSDNQVADTLYLTLEPWATFNLWDVLGSNYFATEGTGAILVFVDWDLSCDPIEDCDSGYVAYLHPRSRWRGWRVRSDHSRLEHLGRHRLEHARICSRDSQRRPELSNECGNRVVERRLDLGCGGCPECRRRHRRELQHRGAAIRSRSGTAADSD